MKDLTINEIKEKQVELEQNLKQILQDFHDETGLIVKGEIGFGHTTKPEQQYLLLNYSNPFNN